MSGEVLIVAEPDSVTRRGFVILGDLVPSLPSFALIGGLAVIVRLGQGHRATNDIDAVSDDQVGTFEVLTDAGFERRGDSIHLDRDLKLDVIDVGEGDPSYVPYLTHRFAFDTRSPVTVVVVSPDGDVLASADVPTARASALLAMKLGIGESVGRRRDPRKIGSDAFDVVRLLQRYGPDVLAAELTALAGPAMIEAVRGLASTHLVDGADRLFGAVARSSVRGVQVVDAEQLEVLGTALVSALDG